MFVANHVRHQYIVYSLLQVMPRVAQTILPGMFIYAPNIFGQQCIQHQQKCLDGKKYFLPVAIIAALLAQEISRMLHQHLRSTEFLASWCWSNSVMAFKMRPKHHYLWHVSMDVLATRVNPRIHHVWSDEKFFRFHKKDSVPLPRQYGPKEDYRAVPSCPLWLHGQNGLMASVPQKENLTRFRCI